MAIISAGVWVFNDTLKFDGLTFKDRTLNSKSYKTFMEDIQFTEYEGYLYTHMEIWQDIEGDSRISYNYDIGDEDSLMIVFTGSKNNGWTGAIAPDKAIKFYSAQRVTDEFYAWFTANAKPLPSTLKGTTWVFNEVFYMPHDNVFRVEFITPDGGDYVMVECIKSPDSQTDGTLKYYASPTEPDPLEPYSDGKWEHEDWRIVEFRSEPDSQLRLWLAANATPYTETIVTVWYCVNDEEPETLAELTAGQHVILHCAEKVLVE